MKKLISILVLMITTAVAQPPVVTQVSQFIVGQPQAHNIQFWGEDIIAIRYAFESGAVLPYHEELILLNKFREVVWTKNFLPVGGAATMQLAVRGQFCILAIGDSLYKITKSANILKVVKVPTENFSVGIQQQDNGIVLIETRANSPQSKLFVYNENLDLVRVIAGQPGATYSVSSLEDAYFVSGAKYGGGTVSNTSSHVAKYDTLGNLIWVNEFPDITSMKSTLSYGKLYFCGINISAPYQVMLYGELDKNSGEVVWSRNWGPPYPDTFLTVLTLTHIQPSPDGGFTAIGATTAPGQSWPNYEPNLPAGLILGYSPFLDQPWIKTTSDFGGLLSGDWQDSLLMVFGNLGSYPNVVAKVIIYSVSGLTAIEGETGMPQGFSLSQNYPNPFNPETKIKFALPKTGVASLKVYDLLGREVSVLVDQELSAGAYEISFDASSLASGMYIYTLSVGGQTASKKMALLR